VRKVFISYARQSKPDIEQLVEHLRVLGCETWHDSSLRGGQDWWKEILRRIADCDTFIAIISRDALSSTACRREFDWAESLDKPVLPVAVEPPPKALPGRFSKRQIVDYSDPAARDQAALTLAGGFATLSAAPSLPDPLPEPPAAPLSYLTDLIDLVSEEATLDHDQQRHILHQLEPALRSIDPEERRGGRDILEMLSSRDDLYADVDRTISRLKSIDDAAASVRATRAPSTAVAESDIFPATKNQAPEARAARSRAGTGDQHRTSPGIHGAQPVVLVLRYAARSDSGLARSGNEDSVYAGARLLAVADGRGDPLGGDTASQLMIAALAVLDDEESGEDMLRTFEAEVRKGSARIAEAAKMDVDYQRMGTTLTALWFAGNRLALAHIGGSRAYLLRDDVLRQITTDEVAVGLNVNQARLTPRERSLMMRRLTGDEVPTFTMREARAGDRYLLCTHGVSDFVSHENIRKGLEVPDIAESAHRLVELALQSGGSENMSVIVADVIPYRSP
jgi:serine/threonine protein phosphatase PrpC